jgi:hypothetical protein
MTDAAEIAEILTAFTEEQRRAALNQQRWKKIIVTSVIGKAQYQVETVLDESAGADEIHAALAPFDAAMCRFKAQAEIYDEYLRILMQMNELEMSLNKRAHESYAIDSRITQLNRGKRNEVTRSAQDERNLKQIDESIEEHFRVIDVKLALIADLQRVVGGQPELDVLRDRIERRLREYPRPRRQDAA